MAAPLRAANGALVVDGWTATQALSGRHEPRRWADIIAVGGRFHATLARLERPGFIDRRMNPWAVADRVAWGEEPPDPFIGARHLKRLMSALRPLHARPQLVHGDLTGNVLFDDPRPPAIVDFSPYWRPAAYAAAIVVGDALTWEGADEARLDAAAHVDDFEQYLLRALIFRVVTDRIFRGKAQDDADPFVRPVQVHADRRRAGAAAAAVGLLPLPARRHVRCGSRRVNQSAISATSATAPSDFLSASSWESP